MGDEPNCFFLGFESGLIRCIAGDGLVGALDGLPDIGKVSGSLNFD